jgi:stage III sporulation protein AD
MSGYIQILAGVLIAVILCLVLSRQSKDIAVLLTIVVCVMVLIGLGAYLKPVLQLMQQLHAVSVIDGDLFQTIWKAIGIGLLGELVALVCEDAGYKALCRTVEILTTCVILWLSIPLMNGLLELVQQLLGVMGGNG